MALTKEEIEDLDERYAIQGLPTPRESREEWIGMIAIGIQLVATVFLVASWMPASGCDGMIQFFQNYFIGSIIGFFGLIVAVGSYWIGRSRGMLGLTALVLSIVVVLYALTLFLFMMR